MPDSPGIQNSFQVLTAEKSFAVRTDDADEKKQWLRLYQEHRTDVEKARPVTMFIGTRPAAEVLTSSENEVAPVWVPDGAAKICMICGTGFNVVRRRHHCRNCGKVVCGACSKWKLKLPHVDAKKEVRVCTFCFEYLGGDHTNAVRNLDDDDPHYADGHGDKHAEKQRPPKKTKRGLLSKKTKAPLASADTEPVAASPSSPSGERRPTGLVDVFGLNGPSQQSGQQPAAEAATTGTGRRKWTHKADTMTRYESKKLTREDLPSEQDLGLKPRSRSGTATEDDLKQRAGTMPSPGRKIPSRPIRGKMPVGRPGVARPPLRRGGTWSPGGPAVKPPGGHRVRGPAGPPARPKVGPGVGPGALDGGSGRPSLKRPVAPPKRPAAGPKRGTPPKPGTIPGRVPLGQTRPAVIQKPPPPRRRRSAHLSTSLLAPKHSAGEESDAQRPAPPVRRPSVQRRGPRVSMKQSEFRPPTASEFRPPAREVSADAGRRGPPPVRRNIPVARAVAPPVARRRPSIAPMPKRANLG
jgi:FYVE zinc finger